MKLDSGIDRFNLAHKLLSVKMNVSEAITSEFFHLHPDWTTRYGEDGRRHCTADACFHIEFLAGAIEAGSPKAFVDYARWTSAMLGARGIDAHTLEENLAQLEKHISPRLLPAEQDAVSAFLAMGRQACTMQEPVSDAQPPDGPLRLTMRAFLAAILDGHRQAALGIVEEALNKGAPHVDIYIDVISESLHAVGKLWEQNKISVAKEHMATAIAQYVIAMIYPRLVSSGPCRGNMVVTGVSGEQHQVGANLVADSMEANGWNVRFLGTDMPHSTILSIIEDNSTDVLCISTTLVANLPSTAELAKSVNDRLGNRAPRIVLGGTAYRHVPRFAREIGSTETMSGLRLALAALCP